MRIAIVGAGIAGLGAAWCLSGNNEVVIYEGDVRAGGHAATVAVPASNGVHAVDAGFLLFDDWQYPAFSALLRTLEVSAEPVPISISYSGRYGTWSTFNQDTPLWKRVREEAIKFSRNAPAIAMLPRNVSLAHYLAEEKYSEELRYACLLPLIGVLLVNRAALFEIPAWLIGAGFSRLFSFFSPATGFRIRGGSQVYLAALLSKFSSRIRLETPVRSIARNESGIVVRDARGRGEHFDQVILAVDACTALRLLEDPSELEKKVLGSARVETTHVQVHTDQNVASPAGGPWAFFNHRDLPEQSSAAPDGRGQCTVDVFGLPEGPFVTWDSPGEAIDPRRVIAKLSMDHVVYSTEWATTVTEQFPAIQGIRNTWFCGGHSSGFPSHEGALVSGLAVAHAVGAPYPFATDRRALAALQQVRRYYSPSIRHEV